jgi:cyclic beta-1,2-glucan synthetase
VARDEVVVADRDALELRRVSVTNEGDAPRRLALASYAEVVLGSAGEDARHPAFSKLFVESEASEDLDTLTFRRRRRTPEEQVAVMAHRLLLDAGAATAARAERTACTDRRAFLGRGGSLRAPLAPTLRPGATPTDGFTLDPVASLGCTFELAPGATAAGDVRHRHRLVGRGAGRGLRQAADADAGGAPRRARRGRRPPRAARARDRARALPDLADLLALAHAPREALRAGLTEAEPILPTLWSQGVSGDLPIVLVRIAHESFLPFVVQLLRGHTWWRGRQIGVDLVVLDEVSSGYEQPLRDRLEGAMHEVARLGRSQGPGRAVVVPVARAGPAIATLMAAAAVVLDAGGPPLREQIARAAGRPVPAPAFVPVPGPQPPAPEIAPAAAAAEPGLRGPRRVRRGGAGASRRAPRGRREPRACRARPLRRRRRRPPPGAGPAHARPLDQRDRHGGFGFLVSESGASTTWGANSGERRLTPWPNDPVRDPSGEAIYLRDEETGEVWSPTPAPAPADAAYRVRHGAGVSTFSHRSHGLEHELDLFVDPDAPVKLLRLRLRDGWDRPRRLTVTAYVEWVLGTLRARQAPFLVPEYDAGTGALLARTLLGADGRRQRGVPGGEPPAARAHHRPPRVPRSRGRPRPAGGPAAGRPLGRGAARPRPLRRAAVHVDLAPGADTDVHFVIGLAPTARRPSS